MDSIYKCYFSNRLYSKQRRAEALVFTKVILGVYTEGNAKACEKVTFTETGSFVGGIAGGAITGSGLSLAAPAVVKRCTGLGLLGVPTGGTSLLACGVMVVGTASFSGGYIGGKAVK